MKITTKTTKEQLKNFLNDNAKAVKAKDKDLHDRIAYAGKVAKEDDSKVTRKDLVDLAKETLKLLGKDTVITSLEVKETPATPVAENSVKKLSKKKQEVEKTEPEAPVEVESDIEVEQVDTKKSAKKSSLGKKKEQPKKEDGVTPLEEVTNSKGVQLAKMFPETVKVGDVEYKVAHDIKTIKDLHKAVSEGEEVVFAHYWTKRHLKQFTYFEGLLGQPKSFENDVDLTTPIYVSDDLKIAYMLSMSTEAIYMILPDDFEEDEGIRYSGNIEFQIYRAV